MWKVISAHVSDFDVFTVMQTGFSGLMLDSYSPPRSRDGDRALSRIAVQRGIIQVNCPTMT